MSRTSSPARLSALDASFLEVESETAHMHVGWVALFEPPEGRPAPTFHSFRRHVESRLARAPRYRQKLAFVPLGIHDPVWVDDTEFDLSRHVRHSTAHDIDRLIEHVFSIQMSRDHSLWELWIADELEDGRIGVVGKVHHCMVDGIAAVELASLFMDPAPNVSENHVEEWSPAGQPRSASLLASAIRDRIDEELDLVRLPAQMVRSPRRVLELARTTPRVARSLLHSLTPAAPPSDLNQEISTRRALARVRRPLADLLAIKRHHNVTLNDVVLAISTGAMRRYQRRHADTTTKLRAMVPVNVRGGGAAADLGNQVSFLFVELPCDEPDPVRRLEDINVVMTDRKATGEPRGSKAMLDAIRFAPHAVQHAVSHLAAAPRTFNVVVSNIPGPREQLYMLGCPLREAYPVIPLSDRHGVAIGFTTVGESGHFGIYVDRMSVPDGQQIARDLETSIDELTAGVPPVRGKYGPEARRHADSNT